MSRIDYEKAKQMLEKHKKDREASGGGGSNEDRRWFKLPEEGSVKIRFLPPTEDQTLPGMIVYKHYNIPTGVEKFKKGSPTCLKTWGLDCPICKVLEEYRGRFKTDDFDAVGKGYLNVLIKDNDKYNGKLPYILNTSDFTVYWLYEKLLDKEIGDITDPNDGANVTFTRKVKNGAFDRTVSRKSSPIADSDDEIKAILDGMYNIQKIYRPADDEYVNAVSAVALELRNIIEERILKLDEGGTTGVKDETVTDTKRAKEKLKDTKDEPPKESKREEPKSGKKTSTEASDAAEPAAPKGNGKTINVPKGAPQCFGVEHDTKAKKCLACAQEFDCEREQIRVNRD